MGQAFTADMYSEDETVVVGTALEDSVVVATDIAVDVAVAAVVQLRAITAVPPPTTMANHTMLEPTETTGGGGV